ncbi:ricin-type beta-trefoil lectin domain protein [Streptomyces pluripotens]|uniref:Ricin-type beta-trefoil lectin domain protein n=1 Tax=Streptomyces pluripotens TaxID=1355015 RepID=A0A221NXX2_9ACTN|nr:MULTISPECIES: RICIN domain-containing protein [Streptomyces]ARP70571.1 ricin-type beta-trefoil lectin domain protein [Streptomyces pluripotens]ASN24831.1 ricin-type beta-trefoil lectin domain protein [Streptomyces pluripotens]MCH0556744.1 ricin-type beta-trefoil lectin domain protein [Streptomyces sp. MUM 16J]
MAQGDRAAADGGHEDVPDARLTELLRSPTATAYPALQELRRRHHPAVLAYARLCAAGEAAAHRLAAEAITRVARESARGVEPNVPLRHRLLLLTAKSAAGWAHDERSASVDPGLLLVLNLAGLPDGPPPPLLPAFQSLPSRTQGLIWYGVLEEEPPERTAAFLGLSRADVAHGTPQALKALAQACLTHRLNRSDDPRCADFRRLIEEAVRPDAPRHSTDLDAHMARCPHCTAAFEDLRALRDAPRQTLAEGLLPWSGAAYMHWEAPPVAADATGEGTGRPPRRRVLLASAALGVALTPLLGFLLVPVHRSDQQSAATTPAPPRVTVTATVSIAPSPDVPPSASAAPSPSSSPPSSPAPSTTSGARSPAPVTHRPPPPHRGTPAPAPSPAQPGTSYAQVVNVATGRCLDIRDGDLSQGNDVITAPCSSSRTQRWRVDTYLGVLRSAADDGFCLDSRGSVDRGLGIWGCDSVYGRNGENLRFTVDVDGTIRPDIAIETAVAPAGRYGVALRPLDGSQDQQWRAGAA